MIKNVIWIINAVNDISKFKSEFILRELFLSHHNLQIHGATVFVSNNLLTKTLVTFYSNFATYMRSLGLGMFRVNDN